MLSLGQQGREKGGRTIEFIRLQGIANNDRFLADKYIVLLLFREHRAVIAGDG